LKGAEVEAVAVCLLFAFAHPEHERRVGEAARTALPHVHVLLSGEVLPEFREYERFSTTAADAYLGPKLADYIGNLAREAGVPAPLIMQASGGVVPVEDEAGPRTANFDGSLREVSTLAREKMGKGSNVEGPPR
jgi:N-methylhydantoinase A